MVEEESLIAFTVIKLAQLHFPSKKNKTIRETKRNEKPQSVSSIGLFCVFVIIIFVIIAFSDFFLLFSTDFLYFCCVFSFFFQPHPFGIFYWCGKIDFFVFCAKEKRKICRSCLTTTNLFLYSWWILLALAIEAIDFETQEHYSEGKWEMFYVS